MAAPGPDAPTVPGADDDHAPIGAHRLIGDGATAALVQPDGTVDWWCAPHFDGEPVLWRLLDRAGAASRWVGAAAFAVGEDVAGPGIHTTVRIGDAPVELLDGICSGDGVTVLVRLVRAVSVPVELAHEIRLGGFEQPGARWDENADEPGPSGAVGALAVHVVGDGPTVVDGELVRTTLRAEPGRWQGVLVAVGGPPAMDVAAAADRVRAAADRARREDRSRRLPSHHPQLGIQALGVLAACTMAATGAVVASPTTSLPEVAGGDRQFDYRYCWLRDSAQAVSAAAQLGQLDAAEGFLRFLRELGPRRLLEHPLFDVRGGDVPDEREVDGVEGWCASLPIRVGNDATGQVQHDVLGTVLEAMAAYVAAGGALRRGDRRIVRAFADRAVADPPPTNGIWELREPAQVVSADIGRWIALDRALGLSRDRRLRWARRRRRWTRARRRTRRLVLGALRADDGGLPQVHGDGHHDASALLAVIHGMLDPDDPRAHRLVDATLAALSDGPFLRRYTRGVDDGFDQGEACFVPCSWWGVSALAVLGRYEEARDRAEAMLAVLTPLQAEEIDPATGDALGNVPLVWSHVEAARAALHLDEAARSQGR